jgi:hypothetical protein
VKPKLVGINHEIGDQFVALFERGSREGEAHFGLVVEDKEAARRALEQAGVEILPGHRIDFHDPSGNRVPRFEFLNLVRCRESGSAPEIRT